MLSAANWCWKNWLSKQWYRKDIQNICIYPISMQFDYELWYRPCPLQSTVMLIPFAWVSRTVCTVCVILTQYAPNYAAQSLESTTKIGRCWSCWGQIPYKHSNSKPVANRDSFSVRTGAIFLGVTWQHRGDSSSIHLASGLTRGLQ
jgi:hypothetical protein